MVPYIVAQKDGSYITFGIEAEGTGNGKIAVVDSIFMELIDARQQFPVSDDFVVFTKKKAKEQKPFGLDVTTFSIEKTKDAKGSESISIAHVGFDARLIYNFNSISQDLQIPHLLGNPHPYLHPSDLITKYESTYPNDAGAAYWIRLELVAFDQTTYWVPFSEFILRIRNSKGELTETPLK
ncbi:MAG: hypothetical protein ACFCUU_14825 [Cyclobacteriaceae bacterium]